MRPAGWALVLAALALAGCKREPSFDERFGKAEVQVKAKAAQIDADLSAREKAAADAAVLDPLSPTVAPPPTTAPAPPG